MIKPNVPQGNIRKLRFPDSLRLFSRRKTSIKAGSILSFLGSNEMERFAKIANC